MARLYKVMENGCAYFDVTPKDGKMFTLEEAQAMVGGYIEVVHLNEGKILVCDEEGRIKQKRVNKNATEVAYKLGYKGHFLVGDVLICDDNQL